MSTYRYWATDSGDQTIHQRTVTTVRDVGPARHEAIEKAVKHGGKAYCQGSDGYVYKLYPVRKERA